MSWCPKSRPKYDEEKLLITVNDSMEAKMVNEFLKDNGIPTLMKHREAGAYLEIYYNLTPFGIDIYVPSKLWNDANLLVEIRTDHTAHEDINIKDGDELDYKKTIAKRRKIRTGIILLFFIPGIIPIVMGLFATILSFIRNH